MVNNDDPGRKPRAAGGIHPLTWVGLFAAAGVLWLLIASALDALGILDLF